MSVSIDNVLRRGKLLKPHRASRMKLLSADADLRAKPEFEPVGKSGGSVDIDSGRIDLI